MLKTSNKAQAHLRTVGLALLLSTAVTLPFTSATASPERVADATVSTRAASTTVNLDVKAEVSNQRQAKATVTVRSTGTFPSGTLLVREGNKTLAKRTVAGGTRRSAELVLPLLETGPHQLKGLFRTDAGVVARSESVAVTSRAGCAWRPPVCGYPGRSNTGPAKGTNFKSVPGEIRSGKGWHFDSRGWIEVDGDNAVVSGISSTYDLNITADNVTVRDSKLVVSGESFGIALRSVNSVTIERVSITAPSASGPQRLMVGIKDVYSDSTGTLIRRNDISRTATGVQVDAGRIVGNFIHDLGFTGDDHVNGTTSNGGSELLVIRHNTIFNPHDQTDAISLFQDFGPQRNRRIVDNLIAGGGYTLYAGANPGREATATNIIVRRNRFSRALFPNGGFFGPATAYAAGGGNEWSGNVWDTTGATVPRP